MGVAADLAPPWTKSARWLICPTWSDWICVTRLLRPQYPLPIGTEEAEAALLELENQSDEAALANLEDIEELHLVGSEIDRSTLSSRGIEIVCLPNN